MLQITELIEMYKADREANEKAILEYEDAKKYYHGDQLPNDVLNILRDRGQTPIIENIYKMIVNKILGYKIDNLVEMRVSGRQEEDRHLANLIQDLLRVFNTSDRYIKEIRKRDMDLIFGLAIIELWVKSDKDGVEISLNHIPTDSFLIDKYSIDLSGEDASRFHRKLNISLADARANFGDKVYVEKIGIVDNRTSIIESWVKEFVEGVGVVWNRYFWHNIGGIYKYEISPFKSGNHPFIIQKYNIDHKNIWYGNFRDLKPLQDYINFAENRMANMMGSLKAFFEEDAVLDAEEFINSASLDNAVVKVRSGALKENKLHFVQHHADIQNLSQKSMEKRNLAKTLSGLNEEALGTANNRVSGVAIAQRRDTGLMGMATYLSSSDEMDRNIYKKAIELITHYFTKKQVYKIVDKKVGDRYFAINDKEENKIRVSKFDLIYKTTLKLSGREERFAHWSEILKTISSIRPDIIADLLPLMLKDTDSPIIADLEEVLAQKDKAIQDQAQAQAPLNERQNELALLEMESKIAEIQAKAKKYDAQGDLAINIAQNGGSAQKQGQDLR